MNKALHFLGAAHKLALCKNSSRLLRHTGEEGRSVNPLHTSTPVAAAVNNTGELFGLCSYKFFFDILAQSSRNHGIGII